MVKRGDVGDRYPLPPPFIPHLHSRAEEAELRAIAEPREVGGAAQQS